MFRPEAMDSSRYVSRLQVLYEAPLSWDIFVANFYSEEGIAVDLYQPLVTYLLSFFTNSGMYFLPFLESLTATSIPETSGCCSIGQRISAQTRPCGCCWFPLRS
jgi:hypothetical protein